MIQIHLHNIITRVPIIYIIIFKLDLGSISILKYPLTSHHTYINSNTSSTFIEILYLIQMNIYKPCIFYRILLRFLSILSWFLSILDSFLRTFEVKMYSGRGFFKF